MSETAPSKRILVVDDDEDVRILVTRILRDLGFEIDTAANGAQVFDRIAVKRPDLMILDLMMPEVDGWAVLARLKTFDDPPPVIVLTALDDYESFARVVREGAAAHIVKPFRFHELISTCHSVLSAAARPRPVFHERRRVARRGLIVEIQVLSRERAPIALGELLDISQGGAQVHLDVAVDVGARVRLAYRPPGEAAFSPSKAWSSGARPPLAASPSGSPSRR